MECTNGILNLIIGKSEEEIDAAVLWAFGDHVRIGGAMGHHKHGFECINDLLKRKVEASIEGRSGGWLVIHDELTKAELKKVDKHVASVMKALPGFLKDERKYHLDQEKEAADLEKRTRKQLTSHPKIKTALKLIKEVVASDASVILKGIKIL